MVTAYLTDTVTVRRADGLDEYNEPLPHTDETGVPARVTHQTRIVRNAQGAEVVSVGNAVLKTAVGFTDIIIHNGHTYAICSIEEVKQFSRVIAWRAYLQ